MPKTPQCLAPLFAAFAITSFTPAALSTPVITQPALSDAKITFSGGVTAKAPSGNVIVTIGGVDYRAFQKILGDGQAAGPASGFSSVSADVSMKFGNFKLLASGYGFEDYGPDIGAFMNIYKDGATLIGSAIVMNYHLHIDGNGAATGSGWVLLSNTGSTFYQEVLARNGGYLNVTFNSFTATALYNQADVNSSAPFGFTGTLSIPAAIPEPSTYAMFMAGTGLLVLMMRRRKTFSSERGVVTQPDLGGSLKQMSLGYFA